MAARNQWSTNVNNTECDTDEDMKPILMDPGRHDVDNRFIDRLTHYVLNLDKGELKERRALDDEIAFLRDLCRWQSDEIEYLKENIHKLRILTKKMEQLLHLIIQSS
ncbi:unnamed protein product [Rotaria sordida]|uniref:Uncharacterized protein n=1 Tax=Rotaria sordida TaxID=392033 RepID=A0A815R720_9BILA|nr:unnamed protein product [Rotaria sordida]CAF1645552.1 unnamed protein product [Rotaria sordida]